MRIKLGIPLKLSAIAEAISACCSVPDVSIEYITTDSREVKSGDLFFALNGNTDTGEAYVDVVVHSGAFAVTSTRKGENCLSVESTSDALLALTSYYLDSLPLLKERICITGSVGKSTAKSFLNTLLSEKLKVHSTIGNFNNDIGVPFTVLSTPHDCEAIVLELGTNHPGEIRRLSLCIHPTISLITKIGTAHIGNFGSIEAIAKEKSEIISGMTRPILVHEYGENIQNIGCERITFSTDSPKSDFCITTKEINKSTTVVDIRTPIGTLSNVALSLTGEHLLKTLAGAISVAITAGMDLPTLKRGVKNINETQSKRRFITINDFTVFDDSYNSSYESVYADLEYMLTFSKFPRSALLGDILELGDKCEQIHRKIGEEAVKHGIERLYLFGNYSEYTRRGALYAGMKDECIFINSDISRPDLTAEQILNTHRKKEIILFKASHKINLRRIIDLLTEAEGRK